MTDPDFKLQHAPIVEAVLDIECDLPPGSSLEAIEGAARDAYRSRYPKFRKQFSQELEIQATADAPVKMSVGSGTPSALQFLHDDEKQLVQIRTQGFSFNRLAPYSSLDEYLPEIEQSWRQYITLAKPLAVRIIRLRYINRIPLPIVDGKVDLDLYFRGFPPLPDEKRLTLMGFLHQQSAIETGTANQVQTVLTMQPPESAFLPVIFDNGVAVPETGDPNDWQWILARIRRLRALKNHVFRQTLTDQCLHLFQQPSA